MLLFESFFDVICPKEIER